MEGGREGGREEERRERGREGEKERGRIGGLGRDGGITRVDRSLQDDFIAVAVNGAAALGRPAVQGLAFGVERRKHAAEVGEEPRVSV